MPLDKKVKAIFKLMEYFLVQNQISNTDTYLLENFQCSYKTLERYLIEIELNYNHIITIEKVKKKVWKLIKVSSIFEEFIRNSEDIAELFLMVQEFDPEISKELEKGRFSKIASNDKSIFLFKNSIMESIQTQKGKQIFKNLKSAIRNHEYRDIIYTYNTTRIEKNVKCLKFVFIDNNWYIALINEDNKLRFRRLSFIDEVKYSSKERFYQKDISSYFEFLKQIQNSMTLYKVKPKKAIVKATPTIAKYFKKGMKKFLTSQKFQKELNDGSVIFTVKYTQELEVLPFIQKWLPDLIILEPKELRETYKKKLEKALILNSYTI